MADREQPTAQDMRDQQEQQDRRQGQDQAQEQGQAQEQQQLTYENKDYIHVHDFQVREFVNSRTGQPFWDVKLMKGTSIEHEGQRLDVGHYHFRTNQEPLVIHGEPGTPQCMRSIHYPDGWDLTLFQVQNVAVEGHDPIFEVTDRIEGVTPKQIAEGVAERDSAFRDQRRKAQEQEQGHDQGQPAGKDAVQDVSKRPAREAEPAL